MVKQTDLLMAGTSVFFDAMLDDIRVDLKLTREEFDKILTEKGQPIFDVIDEAFTDYSMKRFDENYLKGMINDASDRQKKIVMEHSEMFTYGFAYIHASFNIYNNLVNHQPLATLEIKDTVILSFYGILCRMADEIITILMSGYTSAALILWRAFYEHAVLVVFFSQHYSNDLVLRFQDSHIKDQKRQTESYVKRHADFKSKPLDEKIIQNINDRASKIKEQYPGNFLKDDYSWAEGFVRARPTFRVIEEDAGMDRYRTFYIWASNYCHPNFASLKAYIGENNILDLGKIIEPKTELLSFIDPIQLTMSVLHDVNAHILHLASVDHEYDTSIMMLRKVFDKMIASFKKQ